MQEMPSLVDAYRGRSHCSPSSGEIREALALLDKALSIDPEDAACRLERSQLLLKDHDLKALLEIWTQRSVVNSRICFGVVIASSPQTAAWRDRRCGKDFDAILKDHPEFTPALIGRSVVFVIRVTTTVLRKISKLATRNAPQDAQATEISYLLIKALLARRNERSTAMRFQWLQSYCLEPNHYEALRCRAGAYWYSECYVEACRILLI